MVSDNDTPREEDCYQGEPDFAFPVPPSTSPIVPAAVYECESTGQADALLGGELAGFVYQRDGHPNANWFADKCRRLHAADSAIATSSGMAALSAVLLSHVQSGEHVVVSNQLYGRTRWVYAQEAQRLGIDATEVNTSDLKAVAAAIRPETRLVLTETISNPMVRVNHLPSLAELAHRSKAKLVVDNTFATPLVCQPLELGADLVIESVSKLMNGHGDLMLGLIAGRESAWDRIESVVAGWGFASGPFDCWLAERGLATLGLRVDRACTNAMSLAHALQEHPAVSDVAYPGLPGHPDHATAAELFAGTGHAEEKPPASTTEASAASLRYGHVLSFRLRGDTSTVDQLISSLGPIKFCPSLGEIRTTMSHPASTSHRGLTTEQRANLGIFPGTVRISAGIETTSWLVSHWRNVLDSLDLE